uniref:Ig-like domain-containing surface protein n=1 Tax=Eubacterium cellulosolvens (strain ATCC 43171 / JCM 9499 / 6) TaxID=633697 RepID=I5AQ26_EUBC6
MKMNRRFLSILLSLVMVLGLMPGMGLTAYAAPTEELLTTITATGKEQASYSVANVATVSFSNLPNYSSLYNANWGWWGYGWTATVTPANGYTITKCVFYDDANRKATDSEAPFVVETTEEDKTPRINGTPIDGGNNQSKGIKKIEVYGYVPVTGVELSQSEVSLGVGDLEMLTATVSPEYATDKNVKWSVTDGADKVKLYSDATCTTEISTAATDAMTVYVKAEAEGSATIKVESNSDSTKSATCAVTVTPLSTYTVTIPAMLDVNNAGWNATNGISATGTLNSGKKLTVTASSDGEFALVNQSDSTQKVSYKLSATSTDTEATTSWEFTELSDTATTKPMGIIVDDYSSKPAGTYQDTVTFTAAVGDARMSVTGIELNKTTTTIGVGSTETLSVENVTPYNATDKSVTWSSDNTDVATVNATTGEVTAVAAGKATITATANDGSGVTATCTVTVIIPVTSVTINNAPTEALFVNSTGTLTASVLPNNATDKTVTWSSSDSDYVSINAETGEYEVKGTKGYGSATITATATNGTEDTSDDVSATCTITGKVTYTSLSVGTVLRTGDTFYTGNTVYFQGSSNNTSFITSNGVITIIEAEKTGYNNKYYQCQRGSNGAYTNWSYVVKDNTDGLYITGGSGTSQDRFTLAVHTK